MEKSQTGFAHIIVLILFVIGIWGILYFQLGERGNERVDETQQQSQLQTEVEITSPTISTTTASSTQLNSNE